MKQLFENWRGYVNEQQAPTPQQKEEVEDFIKHIAAVLDGIQAGQEEGAPVEERRRKSPAEHIRRNNIQHTKRIKKEAGLEGIKIKDFTPEQLQAFESAKEAVKLQDDAHNAALKTTLAHGNILELPIIKQIYKAGGNFLKAALGAVIGPECVDNLSVTCIAAAKISTGMLEQKKEKTNENN